MPLDASGNLSVSLVDLSCTGLPLTSGHSQRSDDGFCNQQKRYGVTPRMGIFWWVEDLGPSLPLGDRVRYGTTMVVLGVRGCSTGTWELEGASQG